MKFHRYLLVDLLEDRRLLAGLDVRVFDDPSSRRLPDTSSIPAAERVVYLDLNADGSQQASEPISISDIDGIARFRNLDPGTYLVRLLGSSKSQVQTTDTVPAPTGTWTGNLNAKSALSWQSDSQGWFATDQSLIQFDVERGTVLQQIPLPGRIISIAMEDDSQGVALIGYPNSQKELVGFNLQNAQTKSWNGQLDQAQATADPYGSAKELVALANSTFLRRVGPQGDELWRIPKVQSWNQDSEISLALTGISQQAQAYPIGQSALVLCETLTEGSRISLYQNDGQAFELMAQRDFASWVRVSSVSPDAQRFCIESPAGIEVLSVASGLPSLLGLEQATGPSVFDTTRGILWTLSKANPSRLIGWSLAEGLKTFDVLFADSGNLTNASRTQFSLGYCGDTLIGIRDGQLYRQLLSISRGSVVELIDQVIQQVAIGLRSRGDNNPPLLKPLPSVQATEDKPLLIQSAAWAQETSDSDGDPVHYIVVRGGQLGTVSWNTTSGGIYTPKPNANGQDQLIVQAYDGKNWSTPQTVGIQIQAVNDPPQGLLYSGVLAIPENQPGYVLGSLSIVDPDANEVYDLAVSDDRFEVVGNTLKVRDTAMIPYQSPGWIDLVLQARSRTNGDSIDRPERIFIVQDPTPFHNDNAPADVDGDGHVTPLDPLVIINYINSNGSGQIKPPGEGEAHNDLDVDGDGQVSPLDILIVINALNHASGDAEGEKSPDKASSTPTPVDIDDPLGLKKPKR